MKALDELDAIICESENPFKDQYQNLIQGAGIISCLFTLWYSSDSTLFSPFYSSILSKQTKD